MNRENLLVHQNTTLCNQFWPQDGYCWHCKKDILADERTAEEARDWLVTGCPWCYSSFVE